MPPIQRRLKFLFVAPSYVPFTGGAQAFQRAMARRLVADGHEVVVLTSNAREAANFWRRPMQPGTLAESETLDGVRVERLALAYPWPSPHAFGILRRAGYWLSRSPAPLGSLRALPARLSHWMPPLSGLQESLSGWTEWADVVQVSDSSWDGIFTAAAREALRFARPLIAVPLMHLGDPAARAHFQMAHQVKAYRAATAVVALSQPEADAYRDLGVAVERIHVVPMGIEGQPAAAPVGSTVEQFRAEHGLAGQVVAFLGATTFDKGAFTLALAVAQLIRAGRTVDLVCAGPNRDGMAEFLEQRPQEVKAALVPHTHLLGLVDERTKETLLAACDLLALPSRVDSFGIVFLEAWLHGKPVIGAEAGGIPDLVHPEETGLLVPFGDVDQLAATIGRLIDDRQLAARLGAAGRREVLAKYTWEQTYASMLRLYGL